ncbi:MAG: thiamine pyrophosphate-binding protein [Pseudomonadota bacterium]|nr:thiamine pyrophosphate-binding protein [Pseudomonadota bacterium]
MNRTGAWLARFALEQLGIRYVFGIPGVHTTELYDELAQSPSIEPLLVTHECGGGFMADAIARTSPQLGALLVVPGAGLTHAASAIGEAYLDGVPMLVLSGGIRHHGGRAYQLHDIDQQALMRPITKGCWRIERHNDVVPTIYRAYREAVTGRPGPVYVELPVDVMLFSGEVGALPEWPGVSLETPVDQAAIEQACELIAKARRPGLFIGWGARHAQAELVALAEMIGAPAATTLQGLSSFPADHPLHAGMGFGLAAAPAAQNAFKDCDCLIAIGTRFSEVGTGSYSVEVPAALVHIDIDPEVFDKNFPAAVKIAADARQALAALNAALGRRGTVRDPGKLAARIAGDKAAYVREYRRGGDRSRVNPARLLGAVDRLWSRDAIVVADDGNHTFLTAEFLPMCAGRRFISPTDFNCMGYAVPAAIGAKLANPAREVVAVVGDGAFLMTGTELLTAAANGLGIVVLVFNDGELAQIAQAQQLPYNRKTCTVLKPQDLAAAAAATHSRYLAIDSDDSVDCVLDVARTEAARGTPVLVNVRIDYSQKTAFTKGIIAVNRKRMAAREQLRIGARALTRHVVGA